MAYNERQSWASHMLNYVTQQFPGYNFAMGKCLIRDRHDLFVYKQLNKGTSIPGVGQEPLCTIELPEKYSDPTGENLRTFMAKLALVCG